MAASHARDLIDRPTFREVSEEQRAAIRRDPAAAKLSTRAVIRLVENQLKEARLGEYTILCDEAKSRRGGGVAPSPLQYLVAAVGF